MRIQPGLTTTESDSKRRESDDSPQMTHRAKRRSKEEERTSSGPVRRAEMGRGAAHHSVLLSVFSVLSEVRNPGR
jgi:hypothetical protein